MPEKEGSFNNQESEEQTPRPHLLDGVKSDGRWAQVIWDGDYIRYLDDESEVPTKINWDDFRLTRDWKEIPVWEVKKSASFTQAELERIHWGPEQDQNPQLREEVDVFGEFEKRQTKGRHN